MFHGVWVHKKTQFDYKVVEIEFLKFRYYLVNERFFPIMFSFFKNTEKKKKKKKDFHFTIENMEEN